MVRNLVQVMKVRMMDVQPGDVINKNAEDARGWFLVDDIQQLPSGDYAVLAATDKNSINGSPYEIVGVQVVKTVEVAAAAA